MLDKKLEINVKKEKTKERTIGKITKQLKIKIINQKRNITK